MAGTARHYFPGNNTPEGFFSYYHNIQSQREADKIWYIKGGPGTGKSTFMRRIAEAMLKEGMKVDFLHCSADSDSLDGILLPEKRIAIVDGTRPHVMDPLNPGAVDSIIHLGEFWNEGEIRRNRLAIIETTERISAIYRVAYQYLAAAEKIYDALCSIQSHRIKETEYYKIAAGMIGGELAHKELSSQAGHVKRFFAGAISPKGHVNFIGSLAKGYGRVYLLHSVTGSGSGRILDLFLESALYRGFDGEAYYCPMKPRSGIEHLLLPGLSVAILTSNEYHRISSSDCGGEVVEIDLSGLMEENLTAFQKDMAGTAKEDLDSMLKRAVSCLAEAKKEHDLLESYYIPSMDFERIEGLRMKIEDEIRRR